MKERNKWFVALLVFVFALIFCMSLVSLAAEPALKIGIVDINKIMKDSKAAKNAKAVFQKDLDAKKATVKTKSDKVTALDKELKGIDQKSSAWKEKRDKLVKEVNELRTLEKQMNQELQKKDIEMTKKIFADVQQILNKLIKAENYSLILDKKAVLAGKDGFDITDKIIKTYDSQTR
ncbi:outer membrane protein h precursor [hydrocarbon metagenome]|uniref:Outer membrane protein h n=1 Tax=hydrocarbon metagenome TaxID=938273 RepID=A0A0W8FPJ4_9ZZZZ